MVHEFTSILLGALHNCQVHRDINQRLEFNADKS
jgi:hypothetical protein